MKIPKKITPDRIKDAIVEIRYTSKLPFEVIPGYIFQALDDSYRYMVRPSANFPPELSGAPIQLGSHLFHKDEIKIVLKPGSFVFNCLNSYVSWSKYLPEIDNFLKQIESSGVVEKFNRVGLRYVSIYENMDILPVLNFSFQIKLEEFSPKNMHFNSEFAYKGNTVILNIANQEPQPTASQKPNRLPSLSAIDIDVIKNITVDSKDRNTLVNELETIHNIEKEIYFSLMTEEFISTLKPEY